MKCNERILTTTKMISFSLYNLALFISHPFLAYSQYIATRRYLAEITRKKKKMAKKKKTKYERRYRKIFLCSSTI